MKASVVGILDSGGWFWLNHNLQIALAFVHSFFVCWFLEILLVNWTNSINDQVFKVLKSTIILFFNELKFLFI